MGKNNKARRAAKARQRARRQRQRRAQHQDGRAQENVEQQWPFGNPQGPAGRRVPSQSERAAHQWAEVLRATQRAPHQVPTLIEQLTALSEDVVDGLAEGIVRERLDVLWRYGWQPAELRRELRRRTDAATGRLVELAILADHDLRVGQRVDPRWSAQLAEFDQRTVSTRSGWLAGWRAREVLDRASSYEAVVRAGAEASRLPPLDVLIPPPGSDDSVVTLGAPARTGTHPMLERVRKLLAKAEASDFEEEATTFTAKAQELMTRHAIDEALLHADYAQDVPRMVRLPVESPYADAKSVLLDVVASANRCRAVYLKGFEMSSVVGHTDDLSVVELLFTSLLVQAQHALAKVGRTSPAGRRTRSRSFRTSFFLAYAERIRERLEATNERVLDEDDSSSALPVLRARDAAVDDFFEERFGGQLTSSPVRGGYDGAGFSYGRQAADQARLDAGAITG